MSGFISPQVHAHGWLWHSFSSEPRPSAWWMRLVARAGTGSGEMRGATTTFVAMVAMVALLVGPARSSDMFTDTTEAVNPYGSCALKTSTVGESGWAFDVAPHAYPETSGVTPTQLWYCDEPFPNTNFYHEDEEVIGTYNSRSQDDCFKFFPGDGAAYQISDVNYDAVWKDGCPYTCWDCASLCSQQALNASFEAAPEATRRRIMDSRGSYYANIPITIRNFDTSSGLDTTLHGCNAWTFCANPGGCVHDGKTQPGFTCTLKRIPLSSAPMIQALERGYSDTPRGAPDGLVAESSSGPGSDFVSG